VAPVASEVSAATVQPALHFPSGIPGFPGLHEFVLEALEPVGALYELRGVDDPSLRLLLAPPGVFFPDYMPELDEPSVEMLGLTEEDEAQVLVVLTTGPKPSDATANLMAPIVVNLRTGAAAQVILASSGLPLRAPIAG
jgi:flagellar assembly factor FliW